MLFSDMSGYTAMSEKLDPEEVKEIMGKIFGEISKAIPRYEGVIDKFIGDAVMALFGVPQSHEDDPVRAIKAAREIHEIVSSISPQYEKRIGKPLAMHTGICTGLVVTGEMNLEKGTPGVLGDTINIASRLTALAKPGEIVISPDTCHQAEQLLKYGRQHSNIRSIVCGHVCISHYGLATGNLHMANQSGQMAAKIALDRFYRYWSRLAEGGGYISAGQLTEAQEVFEEISAYSHEYGCDCIEVQSDIFLGTIYVSQGHMSRGLTLVERIRSRCEESEGKMNIIMAEYILGKIYKKINEGAGPISPVIIAKNIGFLVKNVPFSARKAEQHFLKAIEVAQEIGAKGILGKVKFDLGLLHKIKGRADEARKCVSEAIQLFEECEADVSLKQAREALVALG